ncbi:Crp/Fnr family transcriptional regulator [Sediminitomix flava]|uniref:CRP-like cAMP-binding protein n=1 Tax=Sediminitomix flava TaxID=379075 RepID=A0A315ZC35_SEDFL|nr:Crp/Fnr family transcriptional regulator [Sediminitomix flava]PWJ42872.1 CRP-like cAMP-binding protein [Sediminitomix flava]
MDCISCENTNCLIKQSCFTTNIAEEDLFINAIRCKKGQTFILEGSPIYGLYFIQSGRVKVSTTGYQGKEQILRFAGEGEVLGHRGFGVSEIYQVSATTLEDSVICHVSNSNLESLFAKYPEFTFNMMQFYAQELNRSETKVRKLAQMSVREKVIDTLLYINRKFGHNYAYMSLELSRKEIADYAGTTDEQVIRIISALKKEKLVISQGRKIGIPDVDLLKREIAEHNFYLDS